MQALGLAEPAALASELDGSSRVDVKTVSWLLRHSNVRTTIGIDSHAVDPTSWRHKEGSWTGCWVRHEDIRRLEARNAARNN